MTGNKSREKEIYKVTLTGSVVNIALVIFKFIAGVLGRSSAMIADAVHSLSDLITDVIIILFVRISNKPRDATHEYGHGKFETFATLIIGITLIVVGIGIGYEGIMKIKAVINGAILPKPGWIALVVAILSILSKEILYHYTVAKGKSLKSDVLIANGWHHRSDAFSSIGTAVGIGGAVLLGSKWTVLDPVAAVIVSMLIIYTAWKLMRPAIDELLEKSLPDEVEKEIADTTLSFPGVFDLHNLRTRKIGNQYAIEFHLRMHADKTLKETHDMGSAIEKRLKEIYGEKTHVIIHMEPEKQ
ncbi:MAG: cation diffusion facilitator family transporter [Candidatus Azobacteroides sp.]|nr:cation diffusion facilitator family transporter [Candidatus Azobacteroides sp.]